MPNAVLRFPVLSVLIVSAALLACKKSGPQEVKGSCDMRSAASGSSSICIDFHTEPNAKVKSICSPESGYILATTGCDTSTALGGCQKGKLTNWYYASSKHSSADDVKRECSDTFVTPGGK
ncbi:MAG: hypothetical protein IPI67_10420 [Myxococcales bacterium]|nr:hypothetical protein [Myxococcales bacterium]